VSGVGAGSPDIQFPALTEHVSRASSQYRHLPVECGGHAGCGTEGSRWKGGLLQLLQDLLLTGVGPSDPSGPGVGAGHREIACGRRSRYRSKGEDHVGDALGWGSGWPSLHRTTPKRLLR